MKIGIIFNPVSGSGESPAAANRLQNYLLGHDVESALLESAHTYDQALEEFASAVDFLVVAGGDGTLLPLLDALSSTGTPVYMIPTGNESLFAREFGMTSDFSQFLRSARANKVGIHHLASINGSLFFTMASIGFDSCVVKEVAAERTGPIGHIGYVKPSFRALRCFHPPQFEVIVDGRPVVSGKQGFLVISNNKQYALRLYFNRDADSRKQELKATFMPCRNFLSYLGWQLRCLAGRLSDAPSALRLSGIKFEVRTSAPYPVQIDGEFFGSTPVSIAASPRTIRVLLPS